ncbi:hypothetical protein PCASD_03483 [Puccinia coronata f. sp. avenae]|uniref:Uncharacterized protein n=1 Tax=Puccinia coronata f. sp. avenae TaxID=200324 RepID=A0A2N5V7K6_9BASI|nr:hypothetical protein PCASD_03483 [Puccinia coronata f. sp. avenae]
MGSPNPIGFGPVLVMAFLLGACQALPPGGSNWVVQSRSCLLAPGKTQVSRRPQLPRRRVNNFQLANVMEPQSSPPAPAPGSDADILVDNSVSNAPATRPASYCPEVPTGSMIVPGKHQTRQATRRQPAGSMSRSRIRVWHHLGLFFPGPTGPIRFRALLGRTAGGPKPPDWLPEPVYNPPVYNLPVNNTAAKYKAHSSCTTPHHSLQLLVHFVYVIEWNVIRLILSIDKTTRLRKPLETFWAWCDIAQPTAQANS